MSLESGQYYITSADGGFPIGRKPVEDPNRVPKGIYKLPDGTQSVWDVEKLDNGHYKLKNGGDIVGGIAKHLFAFPVPDPTATTEWIFGLSLKHQGQDEYYAIQGASTPTDGLWSVPTLSVETNPQITVGPVIANPTNPPKYPPNAVFFFKKVDA